MKQIGITDITVSIVIRATHINPWVLSRLDHLLGYYDPKPKFQVIDFGSEGRYKEQIRMICQGRSKYIYVDDKGTFSLAIGRNVAFVNCETEYLFFSDVDFISKRTLFCDLVKLANSLKFSQKGKGFILLPIYHMSSYSTKQYEEIVFDENE